MKKTYTILAVTVTVLPLILAAAIKSVIPIVFWFFPVATYLFISRGKRMNKTDEKEKADFEKDEIGKDNKNGKNLI